MTSASPRLSAARILAAAALLVAGLLLFGAYEPGPGRVAPAVVALR